jgi:GTP-binding protein
LKIEASFVRSAATASDLPHDSLAEVALVGRSNVGKSSLINSLVRQRIARTSAAPGKTRLANIYRVVRGSGEPFYLVDLPGYGYARGGADAARGFDELTRAFFSRGIRLQPDFQPDRAPGQARLKPDPTHGVGALLLVDSRHPGLEKDVEAWRWLRATAERCGIVATKIDKLARGQRIRAMRELESVFDHSVLPVSAVTGEGLDELWTLIDNLTNHRNPPGKSSLNNLNRLNRLNRLNPSSHPKATAEPRADRPPSGHRVQRGHRAAARRPKKALRPLKK